jgi:hypothetical protein
MTPEQIANDIMDNACLGVAHVENGVDATIRHSIAEAIKDAFQRGVNLGVTGRIEIEFNPPQRERQWKATWVEHVEER